MFDKSFFTFLGQPVEHSGTPLDIVNTFLEGIFGDVLPYKIPDLVTFFSRQEYKSTRLINTEETHTIGHKISLGKLEI